MTLVILDRAASYVGSFAISDSGFAPHRISRTASVRKAGG
jgi:hypothetical protein